MAKKPSCENTAVKKGPWSAEEDRPLKSYIEKHGIEGGCVSLPRKAGLKRSGKSCKLRWLNYLKPGLKHGNYTAAEEKLLCKLYSVIGRRLQMVDNSRAIAWENRKRLKKPLEYASETKMDELAAATKMAEIRKPLLGSMTAFFGNCMRGK